MYGTSYVFEKKKKKKEEFEIFFASDVIVFSNFKQINIFDVLRSLRKMPIFRGTFVNFCVTARV